jgi:ABC-type dipeptide/oligopeptide/nickel transport system ATPase component
MEAVLKVTDLTVSFPTENGLVTAVRGLSSISRLARWSALSMSLNGQGSVLPGDHGAVARQRASHGLGAVPWQELVSLDDRGLSAVRGKGIAMIFQDPLSALTPVYTVGGQIAEPCGPTRRCPAGRRPGVPLSYSTWSGSQMQHSVPGLPAGVLRGNAPARDDCHPRS